MYAAILLQDNKLNEAETYAFRAVKLNKKNPHFRNTYGNILRLKGKHKEAVEEYKAAITFEPRVPDFFNGMGLVFQDMGQHEKALEYFKKSIELKSDYAFAYMNAAISYDKILDIKTALKFIEKAHSLDSNNALILLNLAHIYKNNMKYLEAIKIAEELVNKDVPYILAYTTLAESYYFYGEHDKAVAAYDIAIKKFPENVGLKIQQKLLFPHMVNNHEEIDAIREKFFKGLEDIINSDIKLENLEFSGIIMPFYHAYYARNDKDIRIKLYEMFLKISPSLNFTAKHCENYSFNKNRKVRIAFISNYFSEHIISTLTNELISFIAKSESYEVYALTLSPKQDDLTKKLSKECKFIILPNDLEKVRNELEKLELDIIIYPEIGMSFSIYLLAFGRYAPVQAVISTGHPLTSGIKTIDYSISYKALEPEDTEEHYTEKLVKLDSTYAIVAEPAPPKKNFPLNEFGLPEDKKLYFCPVLTHRIHFDMDEVFSEIINKDKNAKIVLLNSPVENNWKNILVSRLKNKFNDDFDKHFIFIDFVTDKEKFKSLLKTVHVILDPLHFAMGTTLHNIFALNVPLVTYKGEFLRGRCATGLYNIMNMQDMPCNTIIEYAELAIKIANDKEFKDKLSKRIEDNKHLIFNDTNFVNEVTKTIDKIFLNF